MLNVYITFIGVTCVVRIRDLKESIAKLEDRLETQAREISDKEGELIGLRNGLELMQGEKDRNKKEIARLQSLVAKLREVGDYLSTNNCNSIKIL